MDGKVPGYAVAQRKVTQRCGTGDSLQRQPEHWCSSKATLHWLLFMLVMWQNWPDPCSYTLL